MSGQPVLPTGLLTISVPPPRPERRRRPNSVPPSSSLYNPAPTQPRRASLLKAAASSSSSSLSIDVLDAKSDTKRVVAEIVIQAPLETVWDVLTDYEALPSYVPNLEKCEVLSRQQGRVRLRQIGCSQSLLWRIAAQAELEIDEVKKSALRREVRFRSVKGDFERFEGSWVLESDVSSSARVTTFLRYEIRVKVVGDLPSQIVSYVIKAGLPANIRAIAAMAERRAANRLKAPVVSLEGEGDDVGLVGGAGVGEDEYGSGDESLPQKGPFWSLSGSKYREAAPITGDLQASRRGVLASSDSRSTLPLSSTDYLGTTFVPLPPSAPPMATSSVPITSNVSNASNTSSAPNVSSAVPNLSTTPTDSTASTNSTRNGKSRKNLPGAEILTPSSNSNAIEVHLRRLDGLDYLHRRVVAAVRVNAPASVAWDVITDYNRLHRFIPALAASERIQLPRNAPNVKRVRQVAYKNLGYLCLHAESVMDLVERPCSELQFRQVAGDLDVIQGKIAMTEDLSTDEDYVGPSTDLKYAVEIILPAGTPAIPVIEPLLEGVFFEDLPFNLLAVKAEIERVAQTKPVSVGSPLSPGSSADKKKSQTANCSTKPRLSDMMKDFFLLRAELVSIYGETMTIPTRSELRAAGRSDLEKCIAAHGGAGVVAARMGWTTSGKARKPKGYWNSLENLKSELDAFIISSNLQPNTMPVKAAFVTSGRYDLARAIERWGGVSTVATAIGYETASGSSGSSLSSSGTILSSGEFDEMMSVEDGFDPQKEQEIMVLLEMEQDADVGLSAAALRAEIDAW